MRAAPPLAAAFIFAAAGGAAADGAYVVGGAALSVFRDAEGTATSGGTQTPGELVFENGFAARGAVGWDFGDFRAEVEGAFQRYAVDKAITTGGGVNTGVVDDFDTTIGLFTAGVNAYYAPTFGQFRPFLGTGLGWTPIVLDEIEFTLNGTTTRISDPDTTGVLTASVIGGVDYLLNDKFAVGAEYRYVYSTDAEIEDPQTRDRLELERAAHEFGLRASYFFGGADGGATRRARQADTAERFAPTRARDEPAAASPDVASDFATVDAPMDDAFDARPILGQRPATATVRTLAPIIQPQPSAAGGAFPQSRSAAPARADRSLFAIQTGAFRDQRNVDRRLALLQAFGFEEAFVEPRGALQVVYAGGYDDDLSAAIDLDRVRAVVGEAFVVPR